ncbi:MAG: hypothetical protein MZV64_16925 [Ignavibacteriales bacterium]|nr:hypothetical protein [Ignavibacteriales bacterium]
MELSQVLAIDPSAVGRRAPRPHRRPAFGRRGDRRLRPGLSLRPRANATTPDAAEEALAALTRRETVPILIPDLSRRRPPRSRRRRTRPISAVSVPLLQHQSLIGTLCVFDRISGSGAARPAVFEDQDVNSAGHTRDRGGDRHRERAPVPRVRRSARMELAALREVGQAIARRLELSERPGGDRNGGHAPPGQPAQPDPPLGRGDAHVSVTGPPRARRRHESRRSRSPGVAG